jgi:hypothetical protein
MTDHVMRQTNIHPYDRDTYPQDDNFENLCDNWQHYKDNLIVFLGAGASIGAINGSGVKLPNAFELRNELWIECMVPPAEKASYDTKYLGLMTLEHAAALVEVQCGRKVLTDYIQNRFQGTQPLWQHAVLPFLNPKAVFTTNYDDLVETGWQSKQRHVGGKQMMTIFENATGRNPGHIPIYKPHGTVEWPHHDIKKGGIVITQFDYYEMLNDRKGMLTSFMEDFKNSCVIFIGYSFMDMDIASILYDLRQKDKGIHWYAVFPRNDAVVRRMYDKKYSIMQINRTFLDFLGDLDDRVDFIPADWKFGNLSQMQSKRWIA